MPKETAYKSVFISRRNFSYCRPGNNAPAYLVLQTFKLNLNIKKNGEKKISDQPHHSADVAFEEPQFFSPRKHIYFIPRFTYSLVLALSLNKLIQLIYIKKNVGIRERARTTPLYQGVTAGSSLNAVAEQ